MRRSGSAAASVSVDSSTWPPTPLVAAGSGGAAGLVGRVAPSATRARPRRGGAAGRSGPAPAARRSPFRRSMACWRSGRAARRRCWALRSLRQELLDLVLGRVTRAPASASPRARPGHGLGGLALGVADHDLGLGLGVGQDLPGLARGCPRPPCGCRRPRARPGTDRRGEAVGLGPDRPGAGARCPQQPGDLLAHATEFVGFGALLRLVPQRLGDLGEESIDGFAFVAVRGQAEPTRFDLLGSESHRW